MSQRRLKTTDQNTFLEREFTNFDQAFKDKETYLRVMADMTAGCADCGILYWRSEDKRCDCAYEKALELLNKNKKVA